MQLVFPFVPKNALNWTVLIMGILLFGCTKNVEENCIDLAPTASFSVNDRLYEPLNTIAWLRNGTQHSLNFMFQTPEGNQHVMVVIFSGDTVGAYPLLGISSNNRASYFGPGINGTVFPDTVQPGVLVITDFEPELSCLSGQYNFMVDTLEVSGQFQSLRPE
ncbi:MAG: hypothetical protein K9G41_12215 [Flavobacteriales bacterium]|nr:hypothetical protein [Flavobacteriales bacterium]